MIPLIVGIIGTLLFRQLGRWTSEFYTEDLHIKFVVIPVVVAQMGFLMIGIFLITIGVNELSDSSFISNIILIIGILITSFFKKIGQEIATLSNKSLRLQLPTIATQIVFLLLGISTVVIGVLNIL